MKKKIHMISHVGLTKRKVEKIKDSVQGEKKMSLGGKPLSWIMNIFRDCAFKYETINYVTTAFIISKI